MGNAFDMSGAAAGLQGSLDDIIKQKFLQQIEARRAQESQQQFRMQAQGQERQAVRDKLSDDRYQQEHADQLAERSRVNTERNDQAFRGAQMIADPNTPQPLRLAMQYRNATGENAPSAAFQPSEASAPRPMSVAPGGRLVDPTTGKELFHAPERPEKPAGPTHGRYSITQGSDADGKPAMIRTNVDTGEVELLPVPKGANFAKRDQPATQDQTNLGLYANRVEQADPTLTKMTPSILKMNPAIFATQQWLDQPMLQDKNLQQYQQASRNLINAVLRRESGAAISPSEFSEARKQYLPVPGDSTEVLAQKAQTRKIVLDNFKRGAGPAYRPIGAVQTPGGAPGAAPPSGADPLGIR